MSDQHKELASDFDKSLEKFRSIFAKRLTGLDPFRQRYLALALAVAAIASAIMSSEPDAREREKLHRKIKRLGKSNAALGRMTGNIELDTITKKSVLEKQLSNKAPIVRGKGRPRDYVSEELAKHLIAGFQSEYRRKPPSTLSTKRPSKATRDWIELIRIAEFHLRAECPRNFHVPTAHRIRRAAKHLLNASGDTFRPKTGK